MSSIASFNNILYDVINSIFKLDVSLFLLNIVISCPGSIAYIVLVVIFDVKAPNKITLLASLKIRINFFKLLIHIIIFLA